MIQYRAGRHATLEHPWGSRAWNTKALSKLVGYDTYIDQCMLGLELEGHRWCGATREEAYWTEDNKEESL